MFKRRSTTIFAIILAFLLANSVLFSKEDKNKWPVVGSEVLDAFDARVDALIMAGFEFQKPESNPSPSLDIPLVLLTTDTLGETVYDFSTNHVVEDQIALATGGAFDGTHQVYMYRYPLATSDRFPSYAYYSRLLGSYVGQYDPLQHPGGGWPRVVNGPNAEGMYTYHQNPGPAWTANLSIDDGEAFLTFSTNISVDPAGVWPGNDAIGNTIVVTSTNDPDDQPGRAYVSTDGGLNFQLIGWPPLTIPGTIEFGSAETMPSINPASPTQIGLINSEDDGVSEGGLVYNFSADLNPGTSWTNTIVYEFGDILPDNSFYDPGAGLSTHHFSGRYSSDGTFHVAFNGAGQQLNASGDTLYPIHPVVYWNSGQQQLIEVTGALARDPFLGDSINTYWPGRGLGFAYPAIAVGPSNQVLVAWQQAETESPTQLRYAYGTLGTTTVKLFATDIWANLSTDGGQTWSGAFKMAGEDGDMDLFPNIVLEEVGGELHAHLLYFYDTNPGESIGGETDPSIGAWIYQEVMVPPVGIKDGDVAIVDGFQLHQNYPNPFNPATTIRYNLQKAADITLEVYNVAGEKVATLVKDHKTAGEHTVTFDAANYSSGIYFYRLNSGNVQLTRKMVLMK
jgi:hypothetical protein